MNFVEMRNLLISHFAEMIKDADHLFEIGVDKDELWNTYLDSFPVGTNEIYRERREHDCSCCRSFIKGVGNVVTISAGKVTTIWDFTTNDDVYQPVLNALSSYLKGKLVTDIFVTKFSKYGTLENYEELEDGKVRKWDHFFLELPKKFVDKSSKSEGDIRGTYRDVRNVFKRSLDEISMDAVEIILELINSNTLYRGEEWKAVLNLFKTYKHVYDQLADENLKELFAWEKSSEAGISVGKLRNYSIGTLLVDVSEGVDLETAVKKYEQIVAPSNYKRPREIFTAKMLDDAKRKIEELGYMESLGRRFARLDDITVNNILFTNKDSAKRIGGIGDIFEEMKAEASSNPKKFSKVEEVSADKFISDILPTAEELEVYLENRHSGNMVSLIAPQNRESKSMFKWNNNFGWAYAGNVTDSMKERVKAAGGKVDGDLRFSIQWNEDGDDRCDLDAHCIEPDRYEIYFSTAKKPRVSPTGGQLDVDIITPGANPAVENITWPDRRKMKNGKYVFYVCQFSGSAKKGFRAEIEFDGQIYSFDYNKTMHVGNKVVVAEVELNNGVFTIKSKICSSASSKDIWGLKTNQFVPVSVMMYSPNYWDEQKGIGHKHVFFMLKNCVNPDTVNGFYNEFLKNELTEHKRVFAALGSKMQVEHTDDQLSGVGFSTTKRDDIVVKVKGKTERVFKVKF